MSQAYPQLIHKDRAKHPAKRSATVGRRPYLVWRDDVELARMINDHLAAAARDLTD